MEVYRHPKKNSGSALVLAAFLIDQCGFTLLDAVQLLKNQRGNGGLLMPFERSATGRVG